MSNETKNKLEVFIRYLWREVHRGNFIPLILTGLAIWFIALPIYWKVENMWDVNQYLLNKVDQLEKQRALQLDAQPSGVVQMTYH